MSKDSNVDWNVTSKFAERLRKSFYTLKTARNLTKLPVGSKKVHRKRALHVLETSLRKGFFEAKAGDIGTT